MQNDFIVLTISGVQQRFELHVIGTKFNKIAGLYIFVYLDANKVWRTVYIGETHNLDQRIGEGLKNHNSLACINRNCATHIAICTANTFNSKALRVKAETELRGSYPTACNLQ